MKDYVDSKKVQTFRNRLSNAIISAATDKKRGQLILELCEEKPAELVDFLKNSHMIGELG